MSNANGETPQERNLIKTQALDEFMKKHPEWTGKPKDDLTVLFEGFQAKCALVNERMKPIIEAVTTDSSVHTEAGRKQFMLTAHKQFIEVFHDYNKEETLFLLAWTHANLLSGANF